VAILLLLDREADRFLAKRADADAELVKPVDPGTLRRTVERLLAELEPAAATPSASTGDAADDESAPTGGPGAAEG
jgi:DNA-binding response OmpR family regulator